MGIYWYTLFFYGCILDDDEVLDDLNAQLLTPLCKGKWIFSNKENQYDFKNFDSIITKQDYEEGIITWTEIETILGVSSDDIAKTKKMPLSDIPHGKEPAWFLVECKYNTYSRTNSYIEKILLIV
jgi:hypothetical protein